MYNIIARKAVSYLILQYVYSINMGVSVYVYIALVFNKLNPTIKKGKKWHITTTI